MKKTNSSTSNKGPKAVPNQKDLRDQAMTELLKTAMTNHQKNNDDDRKYKLASFIITIVLIIGLVIILAVVTGIVIATGNPIMVKNAVPLISALVTLIGLLCSLFKVLIKSLLNKNDDDLTKIASLMNERDKGSKKDSEEDKDNDEDKASK